MPEIGEARALLAALPAGLDDETSMLSDLGSTSR
jgi:hypothetical protein